MALERDRILKRLDEIEARADLATPGPWKYKETQDEQIVEAREVTIVYTEWLTAQIPKVAWEAERRNLEFIAHARQDVPWLCRLVRELLQTGKAAGSEGKSGDA